MTTHAFRVLGLLSGTSVDGIDVAVAELHADDGTVVLTPLGELDVPFAGDVRAAVLDALPPNASSAEQLTVIDTRVGQAFAEAAAQGIDAYGPVDVIASLGQTVFHWVDDGVVRGTLQLGQPAWIAERTGTPVVADLRIRDVTAGGQGAPLASTLDALWLRGLAEETGKPVAALNLGGIANITVVGEGELLAYDTGPANALLDLAAARATGGEQHADVDGQLALAGTVRRDLLDRLLADPYFAAAPPKSTGKEHFHRAYLDDALAGLPPLSPEDLLATLTELTATTVAAECRRHGVATVVGSGGGMRNPAVVAALREDLPGVALRTSDDLGLPSAGKEAYLTALLGWLSWCGVPATLPSATGARGPRLLGALTPGAGPLNLPAPLGGTVTRLRVTEVGANK
ncbi:anhydro-N-acetylmuramic acid kinase [Amycolatopsis sp. FDAARGOS 1241]|uniref:anhydro-N-acetylmuramic acid kinase n=1 Tax=Amycolatopsis sp. FDAARGOS 1241 TaxID=2778070 RepID=UPI001950898E|nr:anhydro-N-acetylmuramic acid kinase [Amycolatopsis sp. FDAARGOS 1241]QRP44385.1 anhydro-N-acetylmuramic acid kinase [Amycolatopsis sp. FDAARGOS 1241]